jgi:hypothetical protein
MSHEFKDELRRLVKVVDENRKLLKRTLLRIEELEAQAASMRDELKRKGANGSSTPRHADVSWSYQKPPKRSP